MKANETERGRTAKAQIITQVLTALLLLVLGGVPGAAQWTFTGPEGISGSWTVNNDIQIDTSGMPVVVFYENSTYKGSCLRYNGAEWINVGGAGFSVFPFYSLLDFEIDARNNYFILFKDNVNFKTSCIRFNGSTWEYVGSQYVSADLTQNQSLAIDTAGKAHVAFYGPSGFKIVKAVDNTWQQVSTSGLSLTPNQFDLRFDDGNIAYLGFCESNWMKANCARLVNNTWEAVGNANFTPMMASYPVIAITKNHQIYMGLNRQLIECYRYDLQSNTWMLAGLAGLGGEYGGIDDLASDLNSNVYITTSQVTGDKARCFKYTGTGWVQLSSSGISDSYAGSVKIALDKKDKIYVTYNDFSRSKAVVKAFNPGTQSHNPPDAPTVKIYPNPATDCFSVECSWPNWSIYIYDTEGRMVFSKSGACNTEVLGTGLFHKGIYFVRVHSGSSACFSEKLVVL